MDISLDIIFHYFSMRAFVGGCVSIGNVKGTCKEKKILQGFHNENSRLSFGRRYMNIDHLQIYKLY